MKKMFFLVMVFFLSMGVFPGSAQEEGKGSVCLGKNLSVVASEHSDRLYMKIDDSKPIYFHVPARPPKIIADGLDLDERHVVKVYFDEEQVRSWYIDYRKLGVSMVTIWRAKGSWWMEGNPEGQCVWPLEEKVE